MNKFIYDCLLFDVKLFGKKKSARDWFDEGNILYAKNEFLDAINCFDKVILDKKIHGKNIAIALNSKGKCIAKLGDYDTAITCFDLAIQINPKFSEAFKEKGNVLEHLNQTDESQKCFEKAKEFENT